MVERITLVSDEVDDFILEFKIDADSTFHDLHKIIVESCGYTEAPKARFYICDEDWEREKIILTGNVPAHLSEEDTYDMKATRLADFLEDEKQRFMYVFDPDNERFFFMELTETMFGTEQEVAVCSRRHGEPPAQTPEAEQPAETQHPTGQPVDLDENFYGNEDFDEEEFDPEGFDIQSDGLFS